VFGKTLNNASLCFKKEFRSAENILIVGGGTGLVLDHLSSDSKVVYVDSSSKMLELSKKRNFTCEVLFVHQSIIDFESTQKFDLVIYNFVLDLFKPDQIDHLLTKANGLLSDTGSMIIADFRPNDKQVWLWEKLLLRTIIVFFRLTARHHMWSIFNIESIIKPSDFQLVTHKEYFSGMVFASLWKKTMY